MRDLSMKIPLKQMYAGPELETDLESGILQPGLYSPGVFMPGRLLQ